MANLNIIDLSSNDIRIALGIIGQTSLDTLCLSDNVKASGLDPTYCSGANMVERLANLRTVPYNISKFRNYSSIDTVILTSSDNALRILSIADGVESWSIRYILARDMHAIKRGPDGYIWLAAEYALSPTTERCLAKWDGITTTRITKPPLSGYYAYSVDIDSSGNIYTGTENGFTIYYPATGKYVNYYIGARWVPAGMLGSNKINCVFIDRHDDTLWIGTINGLTHVNLSVHPSVWEYYSTPFLPGNNVVDIGQASSGGTFNKDIFVACKNRGICRIDYTAHTETIYNEAGSDLISNNVRAVTGDDYDKIFIATDAGLDLLETAGFTNYNEAGDGIFGDDLYCVEIDGQNNRWIGGYGGITKILASDFSFTNWYVQDFDDPGGTSHPGNKYIYGILPELTPSALLPLIDKSSNVYTIVTIGTQQWIIENFRSTIYADDTSIPLMEISGASDWFLPSENELLAMYTNLHLEGVGDFSEVGYWSSTEIYDAPGSFGGNVDFGLGATGYTGKDGYKYVRACRSFTAAVGAYVLRDTVPGGGLIFYIDGAGTTYYEAAPSDQSVSSNWSNVLTRIGATAEGTAIGTGQANTTAIIAQVGSFSDWFLPSLDELAAMRTNLYLEGVGGFSAIGSVDYYWTSTEDGSGTAWSQRFIDGYQYNPQKPYTYRVRACRSFTAAVGAYALRDTGPAGGLIFYIDGAGTTYYEAASADQSATQAWSNVTSKEIGTTSTGIGTGQANTTAIINQVGSGFSDWHLPSANALFGIYTSLYLESLGDFTAAQYWSSSEVDADNAYARDFSDGSDDSIAKSTTCRVRPMRTFLAVTGAYIVGDIGPAGGYIFSTKSMGDGTYTYYEAHPYDISTGIVWSNIDDTAVTGTGLQYDDGPDNTIAIISQAGHTSSAAKLCDDLDEEYAHTDSAANLCDVLDVGWDDDTTGAMCWYDNDETTYGDTYGALYNWYAVDNASGLAYIKSNGVAQSGWRVPTQTDFADLVTFLGGEAIAGGKLKEVGTTHWTTPNTGAVNTSGFKALGSGIRNLSGTFQFINTVNTIWSSTDEYSIQAVYLQLDNSSAQAVVSSVGGVYNNGYSIRLVRDI